MRPLRWLVVHTSATVDKQGRPANADVEQMRRYHVQHNGWDDIGYHYVIRFDGSIEYGRRLEQEGAHVGGFNAESVGICVSGHGDIEPFTVAQRASLATLCAKLCREYNLTPEAVIGHREADDHGAPHVAKTCPGTKVDMDKIRVDVGHALADLMLRRATPPGPMPTGLGAEPVELRLAALERRVDELERLLLKAA